jgi:hypothetical protein
MIVLIGEYQRHGLWNVFKGMLYFALSALWCGIKSAMSHGLHLSPPKVAPVKNMLLPDVELE